MVIRKRGRCGTHQGKKYPAKTSSEAWGVSSNNDRSRHHERDFQKVNIPSGEKDCVSFSGLLPPEPEKFDVKNSFYRIQDSKEKNCIQDKIYQKTYPAGDPSC